VQDLRISLITVTYNAESTIGRCIESIIAQNYNNLEYIIVDGASTDNTIQIINQFKDHINIFISEPDKGIYDAMNKGIANAHGDIIAILNSDDFFAAIDVLSELVKAFNEQNADIIYGNIDYVDLQGLIIRKWRSGVYTKGRYNWGWMPPHPAFYCRRQLFEQFGLYSLAYGTAADYELMLRFMHSTGLNIYYLNKVMVKMGIGGVSNSGYGNRLKAFLFDLKAMRNNGIPFPVITVLFKPLRKIYQYL